MTVLSEYRIRVSSDTAWATYDVIAHDSEHASYLALDEANDELRVTAAGDAEYTHARVLSESEGAGDYIRVRLVSTGREGQVYGGFASALRRAWRAP